MNRLRRLLANNTLRIIVMAVVIAGTFGIFGYYLATHPEVIRSITSLSPVTLLLLTAGYVLTIAANGFVLSVSLKMLGKRVPFAENFALTGYSSVVNFFGPLQSGPGVRAAYLKKRHQVKLKDFFYVTVVFYGFFALINTAVIVAALLASQSANPLIIAVICLGLAILVVIALGVIQKSTKLRNVIQNMNLASPYFWLIGFGALCLSLATTAIYFVELTHVNAAVTLWQTIIYTAAANLALFVSLTPGAIGFRESFILITQQLHGIPTETVISASIIDRAFYVVFLLALFVCLLLAGAKSRIGKSS